MRLLLADEDADYAMMLARAIRESAYKDQITVSVWTDPLERWPEEKFAEYDVILASDALYREASAKNGGAPDHAGLRWIVWSETETDAEDESLPRIFKYQPAAHLISEMTAIYRGSYAGSGRGLAARASCRVIGVYAPSGGSGVTSVSQGISSVLSLAGMRVCYLNMERIPGIPRDKREHPSASRTFGRLLYYLRLGDVRKIRTLWSVHEEYGYSMLPAADFYREWDEYSGDDVRALLDAVAGCGEADVAVIDLDHSLGEQTLAALERCDAVLWLERGDAASRAKSAMAGRELRERFGEPFMRKVKEAASPEADSLRSLDRYARYVQLLELPDLELEVKQPNG